MSNWIGIKTDERLFYCEDILFYFGYELSVPREFMTYRGYLWISTIRKDFRYSTVDAFAEDLVIEPSQLAEALLLYQLGVLQ